MPQLGLPDSPTPCPTHKSKPSPTPGPLQHTSVLPAPIQRHTSALSHLVTPKPPPIHARAVGTLGALAHTAAVSASSVAGTWSGGQCSGAIKTLQEVLTTFYSYFRFATASAAKSVCKILIDHATSYTTPGLVAIAMRGGQKTREVPLSGSRRLKPIHERMHSEEARRETASSESLPSARSFPAWANTCTSKWVFTGDLVCWSPRSGPAPRADTGKPMGGALLSHQNRKPKPLIAAFLLTSPSDMVSCTWCKMHKAKVIA